LLIVCAALALAPAAIAQKWEFGGGAGGGFYTSQDVTSAAGSAAAKIQTNIVGSALLGNNGQGRWGGELRYEYQRGALELSQGSTNATFDAHTHQFHYDVLWHTNSAGSRIRPFVSVGGGVKLYQGTGSEVVYQPLSNFALLTKQQDLTPMVSAGAGVKFRIGSRMQVRFDVHDYLSPFPKKVITPNTGAKTGGWLQDFVPMISLAFLTPAVEN
jgi:hypothetical protein